MSYTLSKGLCGICKYQHTCSDARRNLDVTQCSEFEHDLRYYIPFVNNDDLVSRQYLLNIAAQDGAYDYVSAYEIAHAPSAILKK